MVEILGLVLAAISIVCGYREVDYWAFAIPASVAGLILYYLMRVRQLAADLQRSVFLLCWVFLAQLATWSIFYWVGGLFA